MTFASTDAELAALDAPTPEEIQRAAEVWRARVSVWGAGLIDARLEEPAGSFNPDANV